MSWRSARSHSCKWLTLSLLCPSLSLCRDSVLQQHKLEGNWAVKWELELKTCEHHVVCQSSTLHAAHLESHYNNVIPPHYHTHPHTITPLPTKTFTSTHSPIITHSISHTPHYQSPTVTPSHCHTPHYHPPTITLPLSLTLPSHCHTPHYHPPTVTHPPLPLSHPLPPPQSRVHESIP